MDTPHPVAHPEAPQVERIRHEAKVRTLRVESRELLTPGMLRLMLCGDDLADFPSLGFDDHVKLLVPTAGGGTERRDYTPRRFDVAARTLVLDFAIHEAGPATRWALDAAPGDTIQVAGPRGSAVLSADIADWLLIGDETALPAMGRRIEEAGAGERIASLGVVAGAAEEQVFHTAARLVARWVHRPLAAAAEAGPVLDAVRGVEIGAGTFVWVAAEATVARAVRDHLVGERGMPKGWVKAAGYWKMGEADAHERIG